jgi:hypothetical protein
VLQVGAYISMRCDEEPSDSRNYFFTTARTLLSILRLSQALVRALRPRCVHRHDVFRTRDVHTCTHALICVRKYMPAYMRSYMHEQADNAQLFLALVCFTAFVSGLWLGGGNMDAPALCASLAITVCAIFLHAHIMQASRFCARMLSGCESSYTSSHGR